MTKQSERRRALLQTIDAIDTIAYHHFIKAVEDDARSGVYHRGSNHIGVGPQEKARVKLRRLMDTVCEVLTGVPLVQWEAMYPRFSAGPFDDSDLATYAECFFAALAAIKAGTRSRAGVERVLRPTFGGAIDHAKYTTLGQPGATG
ncbi:hypothetical protein P3G55_18990 [Leptospira sp. 96542]|nr:hypothetical protein [Leptospira sp. 96542]